MLIHRKGSQHDNADALSRRPRRLCLRKQCVQCDPHRTTTSQVLECANIDDNVHKEVKPDVPPCPVDEEDNLPDSSDEEDDYRTIEASALLAVARVAGNLGDLQAIPDSLETWCGGYSTEDLQMLQAADPDLSYFVQLIDYHVERPPYREVARRNGYVKGLWNQWDKMSIDDGLLHRSYVKDTYPDRIRQLVVPRSL
jgi:hypothetical protein